MFERLFTTKMSADKRKLQLRFLKIRSGNKKAAKITAVVLFAAIIISVISASIYVAVERFENKVSDNPKINELYALKETYIGDAPGVRNILELIYPGEYEISGIELKTDGQPYGLTVNLKVDDRAKFRFIDENALNRVSGILFSLIKNVDELRYLIYDNYSKGDDDNFYGAYYTRQNLCERLKNNIVTPSYIASSTKDLKTFEEYYNLLNATSVAANDSEFLKAVYEFIGEDCEIVVNSSIGVDIAVDNLTESEVRMLERILRANSKIGKYYGTGIYTHLITYDIRDFKKDEYKKCAFLYHIHPDMGLVIVGENFITDSEFNELKSFIVNKSF